MTFLDAELTDAQIIELFEHIPGCTVTAGERGRLAAETTTATSPG